MFCEAIEQENQMFKTNKYEGSNNIHDLRERVKKILDVWCVKHNVKLKFAKTHLGHNTAKFFGYELHEHGYRLDETRKQALQDIPLPGYRYLTVKHD